MFGLDPITAFILFSASITVILQLIKKIFPEIKKNDTIRKRVMPIVPSIIGMICSIFLVPKFVDNQDLGVSLFVGFMAGALSTSCYEMGKSLVTAFVKQKIDKVGEDE